MTCVCLVIYDAKLEFSDSNKFVYFWRSQITDIVGCVCVTHIVKRRRYKRAGGGERKKTWRACVHSEIRAQTLRFDMGTKQMLERTEGYEQTSRKKHISCIICSFNSANRLFFAILEITHEQTALTHTHTHMAKERNKI